MEIDDRYTNGVWYDQQAGEFAEIVRTEDAAALTVPGKSTLYFEWDTAEEAIEELERDFIQVPERAIENPTSVVTKAIDLAARNDVNEISNVSHRDSIALRYARQQVEIVED